MFIRYSLGFMIASIIQAGIIMLTEEVGISQLGATLTITQLVIHILAGQVVGYILLFIIRKVKPIQRLNAFITGAIWGVVIWVILLPLNAAQGNVKLPWEAGIGTVISSLLAFITFGILAAYTIEHYVKENIRVRNTQTT